MTRMLPFAGLAAALLLGLAGCAPGRPDTAQARPAAAPAMGPDSGVIVSIRPMTVAASDTILIALNETGGGRGSRPMAAVEFIVRANGGRTVSVVQPDADGFRPGDHVVLTGGGRTRVARAAG
jgi:outer membrane lipoprotein SlyB